jgi:hypothetical protein
MNPVDSSASPGSGKYTSLLRVSDNMVANNNDPAMATRLGILDFMGK